MPTRSQCFIGNSFLTTLDLTSGPVWSPLEQLAASLWQRPELPQFHPGEFMYMAAVHGQRPRVVIHLYKHIASCRYLNLDEEGHAYAYRPRFGDPRTLDVAATADVRDAAGVEKSTRRNH